MSEVIDKTYAFIDKLDNSNLAKKLKYYKDRSLNNNKILNLVKKYNSATSNEDKLKYKKELFKINDYKQYMHYYSKLNLLIISINNKYKEFTNTKQKKT